MFGIALPDSIALPPGEGGTVNLPAVGLVLAVTAVLIYGVPQTARSNTVMVIVKLGVLALFIALGVTAFNGDHFSDFAPNGFTGVVDAAALVFFAYIGFDAVSTASEEARPPSRDLPIAIVGSLLIATLIYIAVAVVAVGALPADQLAGDDAPLATALSGGAGIGWGADLIAFGALVAITSVVLTMLFGETRVCFAMSRDGLLPRRLSAINDRTRTPVLATAIFGLAIALVAAFLPLAEIAKLVNIGTLFAFVLVSVGVIVLRRTKPDLERGFRVPLVPVVPLAGAALCIFLMTYLDSATWLRFGAWMAAGLVIYVLYGYRRSRLRNGGDAGGGRFSRDPGDAPSPRDPASAPSPPAGRPH